MDHVRNIPSYSAMGKAVNKDTHTPPRSINNNPELQSTDLRNFTSMPKTSDAVRRLQEAAAAQQHARETFLRSSGSMGEDRDESSLVGSLPTSTALTTPERIGAKSSIAYTRSSVRSSTSVDDAAT